MTREQPAISVATSVYNGERFLAAAIESVLAQDFGDFEFLLLDDGSRDGTLAIAQDYAARDPRIRLVTRANRGLVASLNELLATARAPVVARFDADDICRPDRLGKQLAFLNARPDHGLVGSNTRYIGADGQPSPVPDFQRPLDHGALLASFEDKPNLCHSAVLYRRDIVLAVGGYRASYVHAEDYDLWLRMSEVTKLANLPQVLLDYRITPEQVSSRHMVTQAVNAATAWLAHQERATGRGDPTAGLDHLPSLNQLDDAIRPGAAEYVRQRVIDRILYSPEALAGDGWPILLDHAALHRRELRLWRTAARLLRAGQLRPAGQLAATLIGLPA